MYDLLIKGGTVIDPAEGINGLNDVAVTDGKVARIAPNIAAEEATQVVEVRGKIVTPGLSDLHTHVYAGVNANGVQADLGGVRAGVTTMVDAGSSGCDTYGGFPAHIIPGNSHRDHSLSPHLPHRSGHHARHLQPFQHRPGQDYPDSRGEPGASFAASRPAWSRRPLEIMGMEMPRMAKRARQGGRSQTDGPHRRYRKTVRCQRHPRAASHPGRGRHRNSSVHRQSRRGHRRRWQVGPGGQRGPGPGRVAGTLPTAGGTSASILAKRCWTRA